MAPFFVFPPNLRALEKDDEEDNHLSVRNPIDLASLRPSELEEFVKGVSFDLSDKVLFCIEEQDVFDRVVLLPNVDSLMRVSQGQDDEETPMLDRVTSYRNAFKIYTFFLLHIILNEESNTGSTNNPKVTASSRKKQPVNSWNWELQRGRMLNLIANSLEINLALLFGSFDPDENYLSFIIKNVFSMCENAMLLKNSETKDALCRLIGACATKYHYTEQSSASIMHLIHKYDFVVTHAADAVALAEKKYADGTLASSLIREIGRTNPKSYVKDTAGAENIGRFLVELADRLPKLMSTNSGLLVPHFGGESFKIRNALVGVLGKLVAKAFKDVEGEVSSKSVRLRTKQAMLEILLEHCRDVSAYTRSQSSSTSFKATLEKYKKKLQELEPNKLSEGMKDGVPFDNDSCDNEEQDIGSKDSSVPDVGNLEQTRALVASLEAGLKFSKCIFATMPMLLQLMASSSSTDVENTILLLMRCRQFQIVGAEACLRKMLPLVFSPDKSIYEAVENAFVTIYIGKHPVETAKNLLNLAIDSNVEIKQPLSSLLVPWCLKVIYPVVRYVLFHVFGIPMLI
ncbi:hypothetical protein REPUB_Repub02eG0164600 [Reevesia pubescens]